MKGRLLLIDVPGVRESPELNICERICQRLRLLQNHRRCRLCIHMNMILLMERMFCFATCAVNQDLLDDFTPFLSSPSQLRLFSVHTYSFIFIGSYLHAQNLYLRSFRPDHSRLGTRALLHASWKKIVLRLVCACVHVCVRAFTSVCFSSGFFLFSCFLVFFPVSRYCPWSFPESFAKFPGKVCLPNPLCKSCNLYWWIAGN